MKIKKREDSPDFYESASSFFKKHIFNKKIKILLIIIIFIFGIFFGLLVGGVFGTLDNPSPIIVKIVRSLGIENTGLQELFRNILAENIKIPFNYIKGQFSSPEKIYLDIGFQEYQKLSYHREQALARGFILPEDQEEVPAKITYKDKTVKVNLRLMGDGMDHVNTEKWSLRIVVTGEDKLFGMKTFSIMHPKTRNYVTEFIYHTALRREGLISLRYNFIDVVINGKYKGVYDLEESFDKELIENNNRREGTIIRFSEEKIWEDLLQNKPLFSDTESYYKYVGDKFLELYYFSNIDSFKTTTILNDPAKTAEFEKARGLLESFRVGELKTHDAFDTEQLAKYFAVATLLGAQHGSQATKIRFYYNPIASILEPIGYNGLCMSNYGVIRDFIPGCFYFDSSYNVDHECSDKFKDYYSSLFSDGVFFEKYMQELERVSKDAYLDKLFSDLDKEIKGNINIIRKDMPYYHYSKEIFYDNKKYIQNVLNPVKSINAYFEGKSADGKSIVLSVGNTGFLPIEILNAVYNDSINLESKQKKIILQPIPTNESVNYTKIEFEIPDNLKLEESIINLKVDYKLFGTSSIRNESVLPWPYFGEKLEEDFIREKPNTENFEFLEMDEQSKTIRIKEGYWSLNESLIIPEGFSVFCNAGTTLNLINSATILSYSPLRFNGDKESPIEIISSDKTGEGITLMKCDKESVFNNVIFKGLSNPSKNNWKLTGAVNVYESPVKFNNVIFSELASKDDVLDELLNIVRSDFEIKNSSFKDSFSDCFDSDFGNGILEGVSFIECGGDGIDVSGATINVTDISMSNIGDKGISVGEKSEVYVNNADIDKSFIGLTSKDQSKVDANNIKISDSEYGFAVYQKKAEFGPAAIEALNANLSLNKNNYIVEKGSSLSVNEKIVLGNEKEVYKKLYPEDVK